MAALPRLFLLVIAVSFGGLLLIIHHNLGQIDASSSAQANRELAERLEVMQEKLHDMDKILNRMRQHKKVRTCRISINQSAPVCVRSARPHSAGGPCGWGRRARSYQTTRGGETAPGRAAA